MSWSFRNSGTVDGLRRELDAWKKDIQPADKEQVDAAMAIVEGELKASANNKFKVFEVAMNGHAGNDEHRLTQISVKPLQILT